MINLSFSFIKRSVEIIFDTVSRSVTTSCGSVIVVKIWVTKNKATIKKKVDKK